MEVIQELKWKTSREKIGPQVDKDYRMCNIWLRDAIGARWFRRTCEEGLILKQSFNLFGDSSSSREDKDFLNKCEVEECLRKSAAAIKIGEGVKRKERGVHYN